jgi:hypothetical protein
VDILDTISKVSGLLYDAGVVGAILAVVFAFIISRQLESFKVAIAAKLEEHKSALSRELETYKIGLALTAERQRDRIEAYKSLSATIDRSVGAVLAITAGWAGGSIVVIDADLLELVETNTKDVYGWLYQNKFLIDESMHSNVEIYGAILTNYQNKVGRLNRMGEAINPQQRRYYASELHKLSREARTYAELIRPQIRQLFDDAIKPSST